MQLEITSQSHNRVDWIVRTKILWLELALITFATVTVLLLVTTASPLRWWVTAIFLGVAVLVAVALAATTPYREIGSLERTPEGGMLELHRVWLPVGKRPAVTIPVQDIIEFRAETAQFQDAVEDQYRLARLWVIGQAGSHQLLTGWLAPESAYELGEALSKAARCDYSSAGLTSTAS